MTRVLTDALGSAEERRYCAVRFTYVMNQNIDAPRSGLSLRAKSLVIVLIPLVTLVVGIVALRQSEQHEQRTQFAIRRAYETRSALRQVLTHLVDMETGVRGYLLTRRDSFLDPYRNAQRAMPNDLSNLREQVQGDAVQEKRLQNLLPLVQRRSQLLETTLQKFDAAPESTGLQSLLSQGKAEMDALRNDLETMRQTEVRRVETLSAGDNTLSEFLVFTGLPLLGLGGGFVVTLLFTSDITRRIRHLQRNAACLAREEPLETLPPRGDELGALERELDATSELMAQRRQALHEQAESLRRHTELLQLTHDSIIMRDLDNRITSWNHGAEERYGFSAAEALGRIPHELLQTHFPVPLEQIQAELERNGQWQGELQHTAKSGAPIIALSRWALQRDEKGKPQSVLQISNDITKRKAVEISLLAAKEEAERANAAKSEFLSRMSHELRTPLNAILGFGQLLEFSELAEDDRESVDLIMRAGRHLLELINEVLDIARIESGNLSFSLEAVSLSNTVIDTLDLVRPLALERNIALDENGVRECERFVLADHQRFKQILLNLLANAIKYNREGGSVTLAWQEVEGERLRFCVQDSGPGIPDSKMSRLFTPFDRLDVEADSTVEGTGIGLALCKRLIELMNGTIGAQSTLGQGSTFWVELPLAQSPEKSLAPKEEKPEIEHINTTRWVILYIEDNLSNLQLLQRLLMRRPEIKLLSAMQGGMGLELAQQHHPHLILLDLHLPEMNGEEVLRRLQANSVTRDIPVIVLSADATPHQVERLLQSGARAYLTKPFNIREFMKLLNDNLSNETLVSEE